MPVDLDPRHASSSRSNILRLYRSYLKGEMTGSWKLSPIDLYRFLHEYFRGDTAALRVFWKVAARRRRFHILRRVRRSWRPDRVEGGKR